MTFRVNGIKQKQTETIPITLVVESDSSLLVRKLLEKYNILVLSLNDYPQSPQTFGDVRAKVKRGFDGITVVSNETDIPKVCKTLLEMGLEILEINSFAHPIDTQAMQSLLETTGTQVQAEQAVEQQVMQTKKAQQKKIYNDPRLSQAKTVVEWLFERIPMILGNLQGTMNSQDIKEMNILQEELKKLRMGNNYEKIGQMATKMLAIMQRWELVYFNQQTATAQPLFAGSVITDIDLAKEEMNMLYAQKRKLLGSKLSLVTDNYALFGKVSLFRSFFQKDILLVMSQPKVWLYHLYDIFFLCIGFLLSMAGGFVIYNLLRPTVVSLDMMRVPMIKLGCLGLLLWLGSFWKRKNIGNLILIGVLIALVYRLLTWLIITNFAL